MSQPSPGPIGEAGATARTLIGALGGQPLVLALVTINLALLALLGWETTAGERERVQALKLLYENRTEVGQLLLKCSGAH